jgi:hypothetical protein
MKVKIYSDNGAELFTAANIGSDRVCDSTDCMVDEVVNALRLALRHDDLIQPGDKSVEDFYERRQRARQSAA